MHKSLIALAGVAGIGLATLAAPTTANAGCFGCALITGIAAGAIVGSAVANSAPPPPGYYGPPPPPGYYGPPPPGYGPPPPGYGPPPPAAGYPPPAAYAQLAPGCHWAKRHVWVDGVGYRWRTVQECR